MRNAVFFLALAGLISTALAMANDMGGVGLLIAFPELVTFFLDKAPEVDLDTIEIVIPPPDTSVEPPVFSLPPPPVFGDTPASTYSTPPAPNFN